MNKDGFALLPCINMTDRCPVYKRLVAISNIIDGEITLEKIQSMT